MRGAAGSRAGRAEFSISPIHRPCRRIRPPAFGDARNLAYKLDFPFDVSLTSGRDGGGDDTGALRVSASAAAAWAAEPVIRLEGVHKSFGDNHVLRGSTSRWRAARC